MIHFSGGGEETVTHIIVRPQGSQVRPFAAPLGPREMSDLSPQSEPKLTLIRSLSPITDFITQGRRARLLRSVIGFAKSHTLAVGDHH